MIKKSLKQSHEGKYFMDIYLLLRLVIEEFICILTEELVRHIKDCMDMLTKVIKNNTFFRVITCLYL